MSKVYTVKTKMMDPDYMKIDQAIWFFARQTNRTCQEVAEEMVRDYAERGE